MLPSACDTVADIVQNAFESGAGNVYLDFVRKDSSLSVSVRDDGCGMDARTLAKVRDPFFTSPGKHPSRRVGLGIPFLQQAADLCGGSLDIDSEPGKGTRVAFRFDSSHIDAPPVGDVPALFSQLMAFAGRANLHIRSEIDGRSYAVSRDELAEALGDLDSAGSLALLNDFFASNEADLNQNTEVLHA